MIVSKRQILLLRIVPILVLIDEDGNNLGTEALPPEEVYFPFALNVQALVDRIKQEQRGASEGRETHRERS